jgi:hypothetical protein
MSRIKGSLQFEGIYRFRQSERVNFYLRFYPPPQNNVIRIGSSGKPLQIIRWFNISNTVLERGHWSVNGNRISVMIDQHGTMKFEGILLKDRLFLRNPQRDPESFYAFYRFQSLPDMDYHYIKQLKAKIKWNHKLDEFDTSRSADLYLSKFFDDLHQYCLGCPTNTARLVLDRLITVTGVPLNQFKIVL